MSKFLPYDEALAVAQSLGLANRKEWKVWSKEGMRPANVPSHPDRTYKHGGWQGWGHWLGTGNVARSLPAATMITPGVPDNTAANAPPPLATRAPAVGTTRPRRKACPGDASKGRKKQRR